MEKLFRVFRDSPAWYGIDLPEANRKPYQRTANGVLVRCDLDEDGEFWWFTFKNYQEYRKAEYN